MKSVCRSGRGARVRRALELGCALGFVLTVLLTAAAGRYQSLCRRVCGDTLRLHIVANSDSTADQLQKLAVRDALLEAVAAITAQAQNRDEAVAAISRALPWLQATAMSRPGTTALSACLPGAMPRCAWNWGRRKAITGSACFTRPCAWGQAAPTMATQPKTRSCSAGTNCARPCSILCARCFEGL